MGGESIIRKPLSVFVSGLLFLLLNSLPAAAQPPSPGQAGYDRWKGYRCEELGKKLRALQRMTPEQRKSAPPITSSEGERLQGCLMLVAPKVVPLPAGQQATPGNGLNESFRDSAAKVPPGTFLPPQPPKQYPNPKVLRLPPQAAL